MQQYTYNETIISYFSSMAIANLRLLPKDEYTYQDSTKEIFLNQIESIFEAHKDSDDTELNIYEGACKGSTTCDNCGMKGYRFVGNHSKNYMDLLFEIEGDNIENIFDCMNFKTDADIEDLGMKFDINVDLYDHDIDAIPF